MGRAHGLTRITSEQPLRRTTKRVQGRATKWSDERLQNELQAFLGARVDWPSRAEFMARSRHDLWMAVRDHGGHLHWADQLDKTLRSSQQPRNVSTDVLLAQARHVIRDHDRLPNQEQLRLWGYARLATAVKQAGGARKFRAKHRL